MKYSRLSLYLLLFLPCLLMTGKAHSFDEVRLFKPHSEKDQRHQYFDHLLEMAMETTRKEFGQFQITYMIPAMDRDMALKELVKGDKVNVYMVPTKPEWEKQALAVYIPLLKGLLGYRLFLINEDQGELFLSIQSLGELKQLRAGLRQNWSITDAMTKLGFAVVEGNNYEGLFGMLARGRFDYFPRGVNEVFLEYHARKRDYPSMRIEPSKALYIPLPWYVFVSPEYPELKQRIETGLISLIRDGRFDELFKRYNQPFIDQANLDNRTILRVANPQMSDRSPAFGSSLWLSFD